MKAKQTDDKVEYIKSRVQDLVIEMVDTNFSDIDREEFSMKADATKIAMVHLRDLDMAKRIAQGQNIRIFNVISDNKEELKRYIEISMPQVIPKLE